MLSKTFFLATILLFAFGVNLKSTQAGALNKTRIEAIIDNGLYLSAERWRVRPRYIKVVSQFELDSSTQCYQARLEKFLKTELQGQVVKIDFDKNYNSTQLYRAGKIKFNGKYDLGVLLLKNGWAQVKTDNISAEVPKSYLQAQDFAQAERLGMWGECDNWYELREQERLQGHTTYLAKNQKHYLGSSSMGWVRKIINPHTVELDSGQKIQLQAVALPSDNTPLSQCWQGWVYKALEQRLIGKKIEIEYDHLELTSQGQHLQRYVWLKDPHSQNKKLLNALMIREGWAQLDSTQLNLKNITLMNEAEQTFINKTEPPEWWLQCAPSIISESQGTPAEVKKLVYDKNCRIKGNITGSKKSPKKTFHTPISGWYKRIQPEQCFENEGEALEAGFAKVK